LVLVLVAVAAGVGWSLVSQRRAPAASYPTDGIPVLLAFHMDCPSCKQVRETLARVETGWAGRVHVSHVDVRADKNAQLMDKYRVRVIPLLVLLDRAGQEVWRQDGQVDETVLTAKLTAVVQP
jgi:thioredoxin-like negative regulator of GroEL